MISRRLHIGSDEPAMADGEASTVANTGTAFWTSPEQTEPTWMIYKRVRTRWGRY